jgi:hypothetical protein
MQHDSHEPPKGPSLLLLIAGLAVAAVLTFAAAVGTSMLHQQAPEEAKSSLESPVAQR